jgi:hypothetical protein
MNLSDTIEFVKRLPVPSDDMVYLLMLTTRSRLAKLITGMKIKDLVLERSTVTNSSWWKVLYLNTVRNLSILQEQGYYVVKKDGTPIPVQSRCVLAIISPRDVIKSSKEFVRTTTDILWSRDALATTGLNILNKNLFSTLHREKHRKFNFVTADIDSDDQTVFKMVSDKCSVLPKFMVTKVSSGWHIVLNLCKPSDAAAFWEKKGVKSQIEDILTRTPIDILLDPQEPIPGTLYYKETGERHYVQLLE